MTVSRKIVWSRAAIGAIVCPKTASESREKDRKVGESTEEEDRVQSRETRVMSRAGNAEVESRVLKSANNNVARLYDECAVTSQVAGGRLCRRRENAWCGRDWVEEWSVATIAGADALALFARPSIASSFSAASLSCPQRQPRVHRLGASAGVGPMIGWLESNLWVFSC